MCVITIGNTGLSLQEPDYSGTTVMAGYTYSSKLNIGIVLKRNLSEVTQPMIIELFTLLGTAFGIALVGVAIEFIAARHMLRTIEGTWETAKETMAREKANFERLVTALYPTFVTERLLAGDSQIVLEIPGVC